MGDLYCADCDGAVDRIGHPGECNAPFYRSCRQRDPAYRHQDERALDSDDRRRFRSNNGHPHAPANQNSTIVASNTANSTTLETVNVAAGGNEIP